MDIRTAWEVAVILDNEAVVPVPQRAYTLEEHAWRDAVEAEAEAEKESSK